VLDVWITCPDAATARAIAEDWIARRLAAAAHVHPLVESTYRWHGEIRRGAEVPLRVRTRPGRFEALAEAARALHPYETPSIYAVPARATADYAAWVADATAPA